MLQNMFICSISLHLLRYSNKTKTPNKQCYDIQNLLHNIK